MLRDLEESFADPQKAREFLGIVLDQGSLVVYGGPTSPSDAPITAWAKTTLRTLTALNSHNERTEWCH